MEELQFINNIITFRGNEYELESTEKIDDLCVHLFMGGQVVALLGNSISINGIEMASADDIINALNN